MSSIAHELAELIRAVREIPGGQTKWSDEPLLDVVGNVGEVSESRLLYFGPYAPRLTKLAISLLAEIAMADQRCSSIEWLRPELRDYLDHLLRPHLLYFADQLKTEDLGINESRLLLPSHQLIDRKDIAQTPTVLTSSLTEIALPEIIEKSVSIWSTNAQHGSEMKDAKSFERVIRETINGWLLFETSNLPFKLDGWRQEGYSATLVFNDARKSSDFKMMHRSRVASLVKEYGDILIIDWTEQRSEDKDLADIRGSSIRPFDFRLFSKTHFKAEADLIAYNLNDNLNRVETWRLVRAIDQKLRSKKRADEVAISKPDDLSQSELEQWSDLKKFFETVGLLDHVVDMPRVSAGVGRIRFKIPVLLLGVPPKRIAPARRRSKSKTAKSA